jgi:phosphatidyl-myo-inositol dimannoside synthase
VADFLDLLAPNETSPVLFVTNDFPPRHGGIQTFVRQLCDELPAGRVVVHAPADPGAAAYDATLPFPVVRDPDGVLLPTPGVVARVARTMRIHGARQVVYGASVPLGLMAPHLRRAGASRQIALTHGHEVWWATLPVTRRLLRRVADDVDVVTHVSEYTGRRIGRALSPVGRTRLVLLQPRVGPEFNPQVDGAEVRRELGIRPEAPVAVCVARLVRRKGQDTLVRLWPQVLAELPHARLLLVGSGPDECRLRRMVARRGLEGSVVLTGEVPCPAPYYAAGDVFAMPVRNRYFGLEVEGLGISYLEARACGLRVVAGRHGGAPEAAAER